MSNRLLNAAITELETRWTAALQSRSYDDYCVDPAAMRKLATRAARKMLLHYAARPVRTHRTGSHVSEELPVRGMASTEWLRAQIRDGSHGAAYSARCFRHLVGYPGSMGMRDRPQRGSGRTPRTVADTVAVMFKWPYCGEGGWLISLPMDAITHRRARRA